jgi:hypothetical protein
MNAKIHTCRINNCKFTVISCSQNINDTLQLEIFGEKFDIPCHEISRQQFIRTKIIFKLEFHLTISYSYRSCRGGIQGNPFNLVILSYTESAENLLATATAVVVDICRYCHKLALMIMWKSYQQRQQELKLPSYL